MGKKKVVHVIGHLGKGGDSTAVFNIMNYIENNNENIEFDFITHNGFDDNKLESIKEKHKVYIIENDARKMNPIKYYSKISNILKKNKYDCIHFHTSFQSCLGLIAAKMNGVKVRICHSHTSDVQRKCNIVSRLAILPICKVFIELFSTEKVACSKEAAKNLFINRKNVKIIYNGIDINKIKSTNEEKIERIKKQIKYAENDILIGHVGRFSDMKNQNFTLELAEINQDKKFIFLGEGENFSFIKKKVEDLKLKNVYLLGKVDNVQDYMKLFDFLVLPSKYGEGLPITLIEEQIANKNCLCIVNSNISKEANIGNVIYVDIKEKDKWNSIINKPKETKEEENDYSLFDINLTSKMWLELYL